MKRTSIPTAHESVGTRVEIISSPTREPGSMVHVIATVSLMPDSKDAFLAEFRKLVPHVLAEAGCLAYGPSVDLTTDIAAQIPVRPDVVTIVEQWESLDALKAHLAAPHMTEYRARVKGLVTRVELQVLQPV